MKPSSPFHPSNELISTKFGMNKVWVPRQDTGFFYLGKMDSSRGTATSLRAAASIEYLFVVWRNTTRTSTRTSFCFRFYHRFQIISLLCSVTICKLMLMYPILVKVVVIMFIFLTIVTRSPKFLVNKYICRFILLSNHVYCRHAIVLVPPVSENIIRIKWRMLLVGRE